MSYLRQAKKNIIITPLMENTLSSLPKNTSLQQVFGEYKLFPKIFNAKLTYR